MGFVSGVKNFFTSSVPHFVTSSVPAYGQSKANRITYLAKEDQSQLAMKVGLIFVVALIATLVAMGVYLYFAVDAAPSMETLEYMNSSGEMVSYQAIVKGSLSFNPDLLYKLGATAGAFLSAGSGSMLLSEFLPSPGHKVTDVEMKEFTSVEDKDED
jgi:hypothetical protein